MAAELAMAVMSLSRLAIFRRSVMQVRRVLCDPRLEGSLVDNLARARTWLRKRAPD